MDNILELPILALRGLVVFPGMKVQFDVARKKSMAALKSAMDNDRKIFLVTQKNILDDDPSPDEIYQVGVVATVNQVHRNSKGDTIRASVEGLCRAEICEILPAKKYMSGFVNVIPKPIVTDINENYLTALARKTKELFEIYAMNAHTVSKEIVLAAFALDDISELANFVAGNIMVDFSKKQLILEADNPVIQLELICNLLAKENDILELEEDITARVEAQIDKNQREYYLHEQMKAISLELNEGENVESEVDGFKRKIKEAKLLEKSEEKLLKECGRLSKLQSHSPEAAVIRGYLESCLDIPWNKYTKDKLNISAARKILEKDHYGMQDVKERIIEQLAVKKLSPDVKGQIICLVGPPGVGKTSVAKSIARAMGRNFTRISLGGVRDEAEIRGHRKTYIGSMPGRIIDALQKSGSMNPVILLDEIDKLGNDIKGDPTSALLEVLDSEQNVGFVDHFIEIPVDLSDVFFITTANDRSHIPAPLYDRMEVIEMSSYTQEEKFHIAKKYLVPKQLKQYGLTTKQIKFADEAIKFIIDGYTREAGVRQLERVIAKVCRKSAVIIAEDKAQTVSVKKNDIVPLLGAVKYKRNELDGKNEVGVVNGLAWTSVGGELLQVEVAVLKGTGKVEATGSLGDVMKESAQAAVSYVRSNADKFNIEDLFYKEKDIHIHVPEGAVPKDGPSAGVTITTAIVSALTGRPVRQDVAMTGEITLRGRVLPIGGLKEKSMAAYRAGIKTVVIPKENEADLEKTDEAVRKNIKFVTAENVDTVLETALI